MPCCCQPLASLASVSLQFFPWTLRDPASCGPDITHRVSLQAPGTSADPSGNREPDASALWPSSWVWPFVSPVEHEKALSDEMPSNLTLACANCASRMGAFLTSTVHASKAGSRPPDTTPSWQALGPPGPAALLPPISALVQTRPRGPPVGQRGGLGSLAAQTDHCWNPDPWVGPPWGLLLKGWGLACTAAWCHGTSTRADGPAPTLSQAREWMEPVPGAGGEAWEEPGTGSISGGSTPGAGARCPHRAPQQPHALLAHVDT